MTQHTSTSAATIRDRQPDDLDACAEALIEVHTTDGYPVEGVDNPRGWLQPPGLLHAWVAELDSAIIGHNILSAATHDNAAVQMWAQQSGSSPQQAAVMERLFVLPAARSQALGERLTRTALDYAHNHGLRPVLDVMAKDEPAIRLYERMGWKLLGSTEHLVNDDLRVPAYCYVSPEGPSAP